MILERPWPGDQWPKLPKWGIPELQIVNLPMRRVQDSVKIVSGKSTTQGIDYALTGHLVNQRVTAQRDRNPRAGNENRRDTHHRAIAGALKRVYEK